MSSGPGPEAEAALPLGELEGAEPQVQQDAVDLVPAHVMGGAVQMLEVGVAQQDPVAEACEPVLDPRDRARVGIEPQQPAIGAGGLQDPEGVPSAADGPIDLEAARAWRECRHDLLHHHGQVPFFHTTLDHPSGPPIPEAHVVPTRCPIP